MKRIAIFTFCILLCSRFYAETVDCVITGELRGLVKDKDATELNVTGGIDARDIDFIFREMNKLTYLDLSEAVIKGYHVDDNGYSYPANEMPQYSFYNPENSSGKPTLKTVILPKTITSIGVRAFANCKGLTAIIIPPTVKTIGARAFVNCSGLKEIIIPAGVEKIGMRAFEECSGVKTLTILNPNIILDDYAFRECYEMTSVIVKGTTPTDLGESKGVFAETHPQCVLFVPAGTLNSYKAAPQWQDFPKIEESK